MAVFDLAGCVRAYLALNVCLKELLVLAKDSAWDELEAQIPRYQQTIACLPQIEWQDIAPLQQQQFAALLRETRALQDELIVHSQSWHDELAGMLQGLHNAGKLDKAYRM